MTQIFQFLKIDVNFSSYTLEDLDHPRLIHFYCIYWDITFAVTTPLFILMLYTIIKKSTKEMGGYKWYLCHQLFWSYIFELFMSLWKPIPLWPFYLGYSGGIFRHLNDQNVSFKTLIFIAIFMGFSIGISAVHRYVQVSPFSCFYQFYSSLINRFIVYTAIITFVQGAFYYLLTFMPEISTLQSSIQSQNPVMKIFFSREPSLFGFDPKSDNGDTVLIMFAFIAALIAVLILIAVLYLNFIRMLRNNKIYMSAATYKLQQILFKTLFIQICLIIFILIIPLIICLTLAMFGIRWISTQTIFVFMFTSIHAIADFGVLIYFVKPYRVFIIGLITRFLSMIGLKLKSSGIQPTTVSRTIAAN